jgi:hypothetical protein
MGFYIRKSISVGPFRFNLSKSGVGVSAGVKGLRFGAGPRGNYVHMGRGGLYYRKTLPSSSTEKSQTPNSHELQQSNTEIAHEPLREIESAHITQMVDSSSADLVTEMNTNRKKVRIWPFIAVVGTILTFVAFKNSETPTIALVIAAVSVALTVFASVKWSNGVRVTCFQIRENALTRRIGLWPRELCRRDVIKGSGLAISLPVC